MSAIQFSPKPLGSNKAKIPALDNSSGATLIELGVELTRAESRAHAPGLCARCRSHRDPQTSKAQYPNIFCSERCEREFIRTELASLTLDDCVRMQRRLEALLNRAQRRST
jgi:hypothetical protein